MEKTISIGKKKIEELLKLEQFVGRTMQWAYDALSGRSNSDQAEEFRQYVLENCHGYIVTKKRFRPTNTVLQ